jgi:hypothetical protein
MADLQLVKLLDVSVVSIKGDPGEGVPAGGTTNQIIRKKSNDDYDTEWADNEGGGGAADKAQRFFSWGSVSSVLIRRMIADEFINLIQVIITEAFNGVGATVTIGTDADPDLLVGTNDINLATVGTYLINPGYMVPSDVDVKLFHNAGAGASAGAGLAIINF